MKTVSPSRLLKLALTADAVVSGLVGMLQLAALDWLSQLLSLPRSLLLETGVFLIGYAVLLVVLARSAKVWQALIGMVVVGNVGWAIGCVVLVASGVLSPGAMGLAFVAVQAITVLVFAALEFNGLTASARAPGAGVARA